VVTDYFDEADKKQRWFFTRSGDFGLEVPTMTGALNTANDNDTTLTVTKVTGTVSGNLSIACVLVESTTVVTTPPSGWDTITTATVTGMRATIYKKITGGSEPATYTWTHDNNVDSMVILLNYTNQDPDAAVAAYISNPNDSTAAFSVIKSLTPVSDTDLYLAFVAVRANRNPIVQPDGWSLLTTGTAGGNTLAAMTTLVDGYAGLPFGDVSADLTGGTGRTISFTIDIIPKPIPLDLETGFMSIGATVAPGAFVLDYGVSGNGWHEITAIDGIYGSNSPYSRVVSWEGHPATGAVVRTQDGNLNGIFGDGPEWGFYAGDGASDIDAYLRLSNIDSRFNNIALGMFHDGERRFLLTPSSGVDIQAPSSFLGDFHSINFSPLVGSGNSYGRIYNLVTNAGLNDQLSTLYLEAVATGLLSEQQAKVALLASGGGGALETGEISVTVDHNGGATLGVATIKAPTSIELKTLNTLRAIVTSDGYVGIGMADPFANLQVARGAGPNGTAVFMGTDFASHFSYSTDEHTYIRGGKSTSKVVINDTSSGTVEIAAGGGATTFGGSLGTAWANLSFGSGWGNLGSGWQAGQYKKIGDMVFLRGFVVRTSGSSARIATLPSGYRPPAPDRWAVTSDAGLHATIQVDTDGNIDVVVGSPDNYMTLSGIVFSTI